MKMKTAHTLGFCILSLTLASQAAVTVIAEYHLGEAGSLGTNSRPIDSTGTYSYSGNNYSGSTPTGTTGVFAPGSTTYLDTSNTTRQEGFWGPTFVLPGTDNFGFGIYVRASENTAATQGNILTLGATTGVDKVLKIALSSGGWAGSMHNDSWLGATDGTGFVANEWVHLAIIRSGGVSAFYINGVAQSGTTSTVPVVGQSHLNVDSGGATAFDGHIDEARVVTFTSGESIANVLNAIQGIPEPSAALLGALGLLGLLRRRRA